MNADTAELRKLSLAPAGAAREPAGGDCTAPCPPSSAHGLWAMIEPGLWVGNTGGSYIGMIERSPHGYVASDDRGMFIGHFAQLADAKAALAPRRTDVREPAGPDLNGRPPA